MTRIDGRPIRERRNVRLEYKELTRQRLAQAAFAEFAERGYVTCTIEDIARRAGTSRATFYVHFSGKVELVEAMWDVVRQDLTALYRELVRERVRDRGYLEGWLARTFAFYAENRAQLAAIHEAIALEAELAAVYQERTDLLADMLTPVVRGHEEVSEDSARFRAALLTIQHERFCFLWILRGVPYDRDVVLPELSAAWHAAVGTTEP